MNALGFDLMGLYRNLADVLSRQGRYDEAEEFAAHALEYALEEVYEDAIPLVNAVDEAKELLQKIRSLRARSSGKGAPPE
jgi:tetratricopeptide (TPR) repeat protein